MTIGLNRKTLFLARRDRNIEIDRIGGDSVHRTGLPPEGPTDDANVSTVVVDDLGNVDRLYFLVARRGHFQRGWKIRPQLEAVHPPGPVALRHLLMDDPAAGRHPLHVARGDDALVPHAVAVLHGPSQHIGDGLNPTVRMPREAC